MRNVRGGAGDDVGVLRAVEERWRRTPPATTERVLAGSADRASMGQAYAGLRGEVGLAEGISALRVALAADGLRMEMIEHIEALYLNAVFGV